MKRVLLGAPYNRAFWWNTARRILNEHHRGVVDVMFTRNQNMPDAVYKEGYYVGGTKAPNVYVIITSKYTK